MRKIEYLIESKIADLIGERGRLKAFYIYKNTYEYRVYQLKRAWLKFKIEFLRSLIKGNRK